MRQKTVEPTVTKDATFGGMRSSHPAFGQIVASRTTGHSILYGSDFTHNATIRVTISASELVRSLSHESHFAQDGIIEVELSEAQWATFVSSPNVGGGVPCTLRRIRGEDIPELPPPKDRSEQFAGEVDEHLQECLDGLSALASRVDEMGLPKGKTKEIKDAIYMATMQLQCNLPFIAKSFGEHAEAVVEKAKTEVHGYMVGAIARAGIAALSGEKLPLQIEGDEKS